MEKPHEWKQNQMQRQKLATYSTWLHGVHIVNTKPRIWHNKKNNTATAKTEQVQIESHLHN